MFTDAHRFEYAMLWWQEGNLTLLMSPLSSHLSFWTSVLQLSVAGSCILAVSTSVIHHSIVRCSLGVLKGIPQLFFFSLLWAASPISHVVLPPSCVRPYITGDEREATLSPVLAAGLHLYLLSESGCRCVRPLRSWWCHRQRLNPVFVSWQPQILDEVCLENTPAFYFFKMFLCRNRATHVTSAAAGSHGSVVYKYNVTLCLVRCAFLRCPSQFTPVIGGAGDTFPLN